MYTPEAFSLTDPAQIDALMLAYPLAALVATTQAGLVANHIPLLRDGEALIGHVALANTLHRDVPDDAPMLAIFAAGDAYVSPNWYPSKAETHRAVPTWNYRAVHVHGRIRWSHEARDKRRAVHLLTTWHERAVNGAQGWRMGDAPGDFLAEKLDGIVAFHLSVDRIEAKAKLSQNRSATDRVAVADSLGATALGQAMRDLRRG